MDVTDEAQALQRLAAWLDPRLHRSLAAADLSWRHPGAGGWSSDTRVVSVANQPVVVLRLPTLTASMFPDYNLEREAHLLATLSAQPNIRVPEVLGSDLEGTVLGRPMLATRFVAGRIPSDDKPTFVEAGWLFEATHDQQRVFHHSLVRALAEVNRVPVDGLGDAAERPPELLTALMHDLELIWHSGIGVRCFRKCLMRLLSSCGIRNPTHSTSACCGVMRDPPM